MQFEEGHLYHIFNQGNNKQPIFFNRENYIFFLGKINTYITPYTNIIAWCLMPNHFHIMVEYKNSETDSSCNNIVGSGGATLSRTPTKPVTQILTTDLNYAIGIMLASYTRAINKQQNRNGSLFRSKTKAECITKTKNISPSFYNSEYGASINSPNSEEEYPQVCFDYIHLNPLKAGLVKNPEDWEFSSFREYNGLRKGGLVNREIADRFRIEF